MGWLGICCLLLFFGSMYRLYPIASCLWNKKSILMGRASIRLLMSYFIYSKMHFGDTWKAEESGFSSVFLFLAAPDLSHISASLLLMLTLRAVLILPGSCVFLPWVKLHIPNISGQSISCCWDLALGSLSCCHGLKHTSQSTH